MTALRARGVEWHQRVEADQQVHAFVQGHRGVHGFFQRAVDVVFAIDLHRREQAGQGGAGLHRARDGHVVPAWAAKGGGLAAVEVGGHQRQA
jgi:hypothetical protein